MLQISRQCHGVLSLAACLMMGLFLPAGYAAAAPAADSNAIPALRLKDVPNNLKTSKSKETALLADDGKALMSIVIAADASADVNGLAKELGSYLSRISGAVFVVTTNGSAEGIILGTIDQFPDPTLAKPLEVKGGNGREAFVIRTDAKRVRLIAATERGLGHVAYRFLDLLGCRWFFPARQWEVVPAQRRLTFNVDQDDRPVILNRGIWSSWGFFGDTPAKRWDREYNTCRSAIEYYAWGRHNLQGGSMGVNTGHAWQDIIRINKAEFDKHPEYYAWVGGKRYVGPDGKLELGNPAVRKMVVDYALDYFKNNPAADMVSVDPSDGGGHSESPESKALGSVSDQVFGIANEVARAVAARYPGKMVGLLAYSFHSMPPSFPLEPNVYIQMPTAFIQGKYNLDDLLELWPQKARNFGFYDYYSVWLWRHDFLPGGTAANVPALQAGIQNYARRGATSISAESGNDWGLSGRGYYMAARLMWNPNSDTEAISRDFYEKAFGAGAAGMKRYYDRVESANKSRLSRNTYALALRDVDEAGRAAEGDGAATARIDDIKHYLRYIHLNWEWDRVNTTGEHTPEKIKAWNDRQVHAYRTRFSYMTHFAAQLGNGWADWDSLAKFPDVPYTHAEVQKEWSGMLATYKPLELHEIEFSNVLVPVEFPGDAGAETRQHFAGRAGFSLYSTGGELKVSIQTDVLPGFESRPEARYGLYNEANTEVARGRMQLDGKQRDLAWTLPAGRYVLDFDGVDGSWTLVASKGQPVTVQLLKQWPRNQQGPVQDMFFYVPKGTKQIELAWGGGSAPKMIDSKGAEAALAAQYDDTFIFTVPAGTDGATWCLPGFSFGHIWFFNVPNHISASPSALLLPREVVQKDGLSIRK